MLKTPGSHSAGIINMILLLSHTLSTSVLLGTNKEFLILNQTLHHIIIFPEDRYLSFCHQHQMIIA